MAELREDIKNKVVSFHANVGTVDQLNSLLKTVNHNTSASPEGDRLPFLSLNQDDGTWAYGGERIEVEEGSQWAIDIFGVKRGYISWAVVNGGRKQNGEILRPLDDMPDGNELPSKDENGNATNWQAGLSFKAICISGEDAGQEVEFKNNSRGGNKALDNLLLEVSRRPSNEHPVPLVEFKSSSYMNKKYGRQVTEPIFKIGDWSTIGRVSLKTGELVFSPEAANDNTAPETKEIEAPTKTARRTRRSQSAA